MQTHRRTYGAVQPGSRLYPVVSGECGCESIRSATDPSATGDHLKPRICNTGHLRCSQSSPKIMVFSSLLGCPTSDELIGIGPHTQICAVHVRMRAILVQNIRLAKAFRHSWRVILKLVYVDNASYSGTSCFRQRKLQRDPLRGDNTIRVGICKPTAVQRPTIARKGKLRSQGSRRTNVSEATWGHQACFPNEFCSKGMSLVCTVIRNDDEICCDTRRRSAPHQLDRIQTTWEQIFFIARRY